MLHTLLDQARRLGLDAEAGFIPKTVRWLIVFDDQGRFLNVIEQAEPGGGRRKGRTFQKVPHLKFSGDTPMRQFLVDSAHYALLYGVDQADAKLLAKHEYFLNLLREAATADPVFGKLANALSDDGVRRAICTKLEEKKAKAADNVTFAVQSADGVRVLVDETHWHDWWRGLFPTLLPDKSGEEADMLCLLTGELSEPAPAADRVAPGIDPVAPAIDPVAPAGVRFARTSGYWRPFPVEYKRGRPKRGDCDRVQLCAQAICLEEMLGVTVPTGALFYGRTRRRQNVSFDTALCDRTAELAQQMHELFDTRASPRVSYDRRRCDRCSLYDWCLPKTTGAPPDVRRYLASCLDVEEVDTP